LISDPQGSFICRGKEFRIMQIIHLQNDEQRHEPHDAFCNRRHCCWNVASINHTPCTLTITVVARLAT